MDNFTDVQEHVDLTIAIDNIIKRLERIDRQFELITDNALDKRRFGSFRAFDAASFDARFALIEQRLDQIEQRLR